MTRRIQGEVPERCKACPVYLPNNGCDYKHILTGHRYDFPEPTRECTHSRSEVEKAASARDARQDYLTTMIIHHKRIAS